MHVRCADLEFRSAEFEIWTRGACAQLHPMGIQETHRFFRRGAPNLGWVFLWVWLFFVRSVCAAMGLAMLESFGREDMRALAEAFHVVTQKNLLEVHIDQFIALSLLFPPEERVIFHETAFGSEAMGAIISAHHDRQAQIAVNKDAKSDVEIFV